MSLTLKSQKAEKVFDLTNAKLASSKGRILETNSAFHSY
jgi:hypothetical protein